MSDLKTKATKASVAAFIKQIPDIQQRQDAQRLKKMMADITGHRARLWGTSIIGFGCYHYVYASGQEGDWPLTGFSPRRSNFSIYIMNGFSDYGPQLERLGNHKLGKSCLYVRRLTDIDMDVLVDVVKDSVSQMRTKYG